MFCAISGKPPKDGVLSPKSKCVFEKSLIEQYINETGQDPITNEPLTQDELIVISSTPQQVSLANAVNSSTLNSNYSIPNLLSTLQNEWDAVMLENFKLRKQLDIFAKQLSTTFYERDAAKLVAANALKEKDELATELNKLTSLLGSSSIEPSMPAAASTLSTTFVNSILKDSKEFVILSKDKHDKFKLPPLKELVSEATWNGTVSETINVVTDTNEGKMTRKAIFCNADSSEINIVYDSESITTIAKQFSNEFSYISTASYDKYVLFGDSDGSMGIFDTSKNTTAFVSGTNSTEPIFMHQHEHIVSKYFLWADKTGTIGYSSLSGGETYIVDEGEEGSTYIIADLHKDGQLFALVKNNAVEITNLSRPADTKTVFQLSREIPGSDPIVYVKFNTNGYWMTVATTTRIMAFDLRKDAGVIAAGPFDISSYDSWDIDISGKFLALLKGTHLKIQSYKKAKKNWESVSNNELDFSYNQAKISSIVLLTNNNKLSVLTKSESKMILYSVN